MEKNETPAPVGPPPFPSNWSEMTRDEKYQFFINGWVATEGKPFESPEIAEKYSIRAKRWADVIALREPDEVPITLVADGFIMENAGIQPVDSFYNPEKHCAAAIKIHEDFDPSYGILVFGSSGKALDTLGMRLIRWPGSALPTALPDDTTFQYVEDDYMRSDEYDELINDPQGWIVRKYLPRICSELAGLEHLPNAFNLVEATCVTGTLASLAKGTPARQALDTLLKSADESMETLLPYLGTGGQIMSRFGAPSIYGGITFAPYDLIGDTLRCTMGIMKDLYRCPEKILAATEALTPMAIEVAVSAAYASRTPHVIIPLHKGADGFMSPEQFKKFYWPSFKAMLLGIIEAGVVPIPFVEGSFNQRLDIMAEDPLPKGTTAWLFDRTNMKAAKEKIGDWACIGGNVPASLFKQGSVEELEAYCKDLIETCGPGGGLFLSPGAVVDQGNVENMRAYLNSGSKFGKY